MKKKPSGYFWRFRKMLIANNVIYKTHGSTYRIVSDNMNKLNHKQISYFIKNHLSFRFLFFTLLFSVCSFAFQGVGDCEKLLSDYAQLMDKSVFLPHTLSGQCVVQSEKHFPLILKSAGFNYQEKGGYIQVKPIEPLREKEKEPFKPRDLYYNVSFVFVNTSSAIDCGVTLNDILAKWENLTYGFTFGGVVGCPAMDYDGSFAFSVNAHLRDKWTYSHGMETQRQNAQITSSTGAVTNSYEWITTGLNIALEQTENGIMYNLKYTGQNGSVTTSFGGITDTIYAMIDDEYERTRKLWLFPIGKEKVKSAYRLVLRVTEKK